MNHALTRTLLRHVLLAAALIPLAVGVLASLPYSPIYPQLAENEFFSAIFPQGWSFFTRPPQEPIVVWFEPVGGSWQQIDLERHAGLSNALGFDRSGRALESALSATIDALKDSDWVECEGREPSDCINSAQNTVELRVHRKLSHWCGEAAIMQVKPRPWTYATDRASKLLLERGRAARLSLECE